MRWSGLLLGCVFLFGGCTKYAYSIRNAAGESKALRSNGDEELADGPILWRVRVVESRVVVRVYNTTAGAIAVRTSGSAIIDPTGQSHPVPPSTLPPGTFSRYILPPPPPEYEPRGGLSGGFYYNGEGPGRGRRGFDDPFPYDSAQPPGYTLRNENDPTMWEWNGDGETRVILNIANESTATPHQIFVSRTTR